MKFLIRSAKKGDEEQLKKLSATFHLCNLPKDISGIRDKIQISEQSFSGTLPFRDRTYLFVLEEKQTRKLAGSSQILACYTDRKHPYFIRDKQTPSLLHLHYISSGSVQLGGLALLPEFRRGPDKLGRRIGAIRFLYMLEDPRIWPEELEVNLTAPLKDNDTGSDFWDAVGRKILPMNYLEISELYQKDFPKFLSQIPKNMTVDLKSLPAEGAAGGGGDPSRNPVPPPRAFKTGFLRQHPYLHFLDGGVSLTAKRNSIPFIARGTKGLCQNRRTL